MAGQIKTLKKFLFLLIASNLDLLYIKLFYITVIKERFDYENRGSTLKNRIHLYLNKTPKLRSENRTLLCIRSDIQARTIQIPSILVLKHSPARDLCTSKMNIYFNFERC